MNPHERLTDEQLRSARSSSSIACTPSPFDRSLTDGEIARRLRDLLREHNGEVEQ